MFRFTRSRPVLGAVVLAVAACSSEPVTVPATRSFSPVAVASRDVTPIAGRHIFVMNGAFPADFASRVQALGGQVLVVHDRIQVAVTAGLSDADAASLAAGGTVVNDVTARWAPTPQELSVSRADATIATNALPQSPFNAAWLGLQWNMFQIHAPEAWQTKTGIPSVKVAILDSGLDPFHPELRGLIDIGSSRSFVGSGGVNKCQSNNNWIDDFFHGTYVGGIVTSNNIVVAGVAPNVRLIAVKVLDNTGSGSFADLLCGAMYASHTAHAQVINMSLGATFIGVNKKFGAVLQTIMARYFDMVQSDGTLAISASGNEGKNLGGVGSSISLPCEAGPQLCVSATSASDVLASYSNFGQGQADILAPGGDDQHLPKNPTQADLFGQLVVSLCSSRAPACFFRNAQGQLTWSPFIFADGTSAAAPHVAGLAALLDSQYGGSLSPNELASRIVANSDRLGNETRYGQGRINVARTLGVDTP